MSSSTRCWIYKWSDSVPGVFYAIDDDGRRREGRINLDPATCAANWVLLLVKPGSRNLRLPRYVPVSKFEWDGEEEWDCCAPGLTPRQYVQGVHRAAAVYVYFPSNNVLKYATFFERNKSALGISGVAATRSRPNEAILSQFFLQKLRRNRDFKAAGSFLVDFDEDDGRTVSDPFGGFRFDTADFSRRPDIEVVSYDLEVANTDGWPGFPYGMLPNERIVGVSSSRCLMDGRTGEKKGPTSTHLWILVPERAEGFVPAGDASATAELKVYTDERELLENFLRFLRQFVIVVGYNSDAFDANVLVARLLYHGLPLAFLGERSRPCYFLRQWLTKDSFDDLDIAEPHQVHVDLLKFYRQFYQGEHLESYRLDSVCRTLLGKRKVDFDVTSIGPKYAEVSKAEGSHYDEEGFHLFLNRMVEYSIADAELPLELFFNSSVFNFLSAFSTLTYVNLNRIFGGISRQIVSFLFHKFFVLRQPILHGKTVGSMFRYERTENQVSRFATTTQKKSYVGGFVLAPAQGRHSNVDVYDFSSLYPSIIIKRNISPGYVKCLAAGEYESDRDFYDRHFHVTKDGNDVLISPLVGERALPIVERELTDRRNVYKSLPGAFNACMNLAHKRLANAIYGQLGVPFENEINDRDAARKVTAAGREILERLMHFIEEICRYEPLYADTDSVFVATAEALRGPELADRFQEWLGSDLPRLEYQETFEELVMITKKAYVGVRGDKLKMVGFFKTGPAVMANFVREVVRRAIDTRDGERFKTWLDAHVRQFTRADEDVDRYVQTRKVKDHLYEYSNSTNLPHVVFARSLARRGLDLPSLGGQLHYVPVIKDVQSKWEGNSYELVEDARDMTVNLEVFASSYVAKLKTLLNVLYELPDRYLPDLIKTACADTLDARMARLSNLTAVTVWQWAARPRYRPKAFPDIRRLVPGWNDFAASYGLKNARQRRDDDAMSVVLSWDPERGGFAHEDRGGFALSESPYFSEIEKTYLALLGTKDETSVTFEIVPEGSSWSYENLLSAIFGLAQQSRHERALYHSSPIGVFSTRTNSVYDCLEKAIKAEGCQ